MKNLNAKMTDIIYRHKAVVREAAQVTKVRRVYDASTKSSSKNVSLNECLKNRPLLQNLIWDILTRSRFRAVLIRKYNCNFLHIIFLADVK